MTVESQTGNCIDGYYLYAASDGKSDRKPSDVFYRVDHGETFAACICKMFTAENAKKKDAAIFYYAPASGMPVEAQVLLDEAISEIQRYDDPDPGVYDPAPPKEVMARAQYALRARAREELLHQKVGSSETHDGHPSGEKGNVPPSPDEKVPEMSAEDRRNSGVILLLLLAQAYYKLLESAICVPCGAVDLDLNHSYLWTLKNIKNLLGNHPDLKDFPIPFEPAFPNLYPSSVQDYEWEDMVAPDAERFLSTVQEYGMSKGSYVPEEGSPGWLFIELFKPGVEMAIKAGEAYRKHMKEHFAKLMEQASKRAAPQAQAPNNKQPSPEPVPKPAPVAPASAICAKRFERGRRPQTAGAGDALPSQPSPCPDSPRTERQAPDGVPVGETGSNVLRVGRMTVYDAEWDIVKFQNDTIDLSPEMKKVYRAMHDLSAISEGTARTKIEILSAARLRRVNRSLSNVLCPSGPKKPVYESVFRACISKVEQRTPKYYLTQ